MDGEVDGWGYKMILLCGNRLKISSMGLGCLLYPDNSCRPLLEMKGKEEHTLFFSPNIGVVANRSIFNTTIDSNTHQPRAPASWTLRLLGRSCPK